MAPKKTKEQGSANGEKKETLFKFIDENVFSAILNAVEEDYSEEEKSSLYQVKEMAAREREKYKSLESFEEIKNQFHADLLSAQTGVAEEMDNKLDSLNLPKLGDIEQEFDDLCMGLQEE